MGRKKSTRIRRMRAAARKKLPQLLARQKNRCHYCREPIIEIATIPIKRRLLVRNGVIRWLDSQGQARERRIATVEHIIPLGDNGHNNDWNLVAACEACNNDRNRERQLAQHRRSNRRTLRQDATAVKVPLPWVEEVKQVQLDLADVSRSIELLQDRLLELAAESSKHATEAQGRMKRLRRNQKSLCDRLTRLTARLAARIDAGADGEHRQAEAG